MPFQPLQVSRAGDASISVDKYYRIRINSSAMTEMKLAPHQYVVISVDVDNKRVGIAKQELAKVPNASALKIDKRGYIGVSAGKLVARKLGATEADLPLKFDDIGNVDEAGVYWRAFELVK